MVLLGKPRQKGKQGSFGIVGGTCGSPAAFPEALECHPGQLSQKGVCNSQTPKHSQKGKKGRSSRPPPGALVRPLESRLLG